MKIYLLQHGDSLAKDIHPERPLSERGETDIEFLGRFLSPLNIKVACVLHSGKLRAKQTAEKLAETLAIQCRIEARRGLEPLDEVTPIVNELNQLTEDLMLVGHMPFLDKLVSLLIAHDENIPIVLFKPGSMVCLERVDAKNWHINWMMSPQLFIQS